MDVGHTCRVVFHSVIREPVALIISLHSRLAAPIIVAGKERLIAVTLSLKSFQLTCHIHFAIVVVADVKRYYAYGVTSNQELVALGIVEGESEDATEVLQEIDAFVAVEGKDHLAVATRLKLILAGIAATNVLMVIDLTIDRQYLLLVRREQRLLARLRVDDRQSLMTQDCRPTSVDAAPIGTTMTNFLTHAQSLLTQLRCLFLNVENRYYSTHISFLFNEKEPFSLVLFPFGCLCFIKCVSLFYCTRFTVFL